MLGCGGCLGKGRKKYVSYEDLLDHRMANTPSMDYRRSCQRWARALTGPPRGWAPYSFSDAPFPNPLSFARSVHDRSGHLHTGKGGFDRDADLHMLISTIVCVCVHITTSRRAITVHAPSKSDSIFPRFTMFMHTGHVHGLLHAST